MADDGDKSLPPPDPHPPTRKRPSLGPRGTYLRPRPAGWTAPGPPRFPGQPLGPPPPVRTGPRVRVSCRKAPPPRAIRASGGPSSPSSSSPSSTTMLADLERGTSSSTTTTSGPATAATAGPTAVGEPELQHLVVSDSCLSIEQHLLRSSSPTGTSTEDASPDSVHVSDSTSQVPMGNSSENRNPNEKEEP